MRNQEEARRRRIIAGDLQCVADSLRSLKPAELQRMRPLVRELDVERMIGQLRIVVRR